MRATLLPWFRSPRRGPSLGVCCFLLLLALAIGSPLVAQVVAEPWVSAAMHTPRNSHTLTNLPDGRVLAAGGWDGASALASAELYNPNSPGWMPVTAMGSVRAYHTAVWLPDGKVLVAGGWDHTGQALASAELYDARANVWTPAAAMSSGRAGHTATVLAGGKVLVVGGNSGSGLHTDAELYDPATNTWTSAGALRRACAHHTATLLSNGKVLVVGGWDGSHQPLRSAALYDPAANTWTPAADLDVPRLDHTATRMADGGVLVVGGYNGSYLASAELYDAAANTWRSVGSMSSARAYHTATLLGNGQVLVAGGFNGSRPSDTAETYQPAARNWTPAGRLPAAYEAHVATLLSDGKVLITGRPDSGDPTGNGGVPTPPGGAQDSAHPRNTPQPPQPTAGPSSTPKPANAAGAAASAFNTPEETTLSGGFTTGTATAALYGIHEVSFTLPKSTNPYATTVTVVFVPQLDASAAITVMAFYEGDGPQDRDLWKARVYVNRVGPWVWTPPPGAADYGDPSFAASEQPEAGLHGMLRVAAAGATGAKRWHTDDGRTFLPRADTAYLLFFETETLTSPPLSTRCPRRTPVAAYSDFVRGYAADVVSHGLNVLRVEALGAFAGDDVGSDAVECVADLSLFWSTDKKGENQDLYNRTPTFAALATATPGPFYPNLKSFQNADARRKLLLEEQPALYVQMLLVPDHCRPPDDPCNTWYAINAALKGQLWQTMIARWAAFPNVFWAITNDALDTDASTRGLAQEVGDYFVRNDPWNQPGARRPMSFGHLREAEDFYATATPTPAASWHTYITAYSYSDLSAQQMDGTRPLPMPAGYSGTGVYSYAARSEPVFNTGDRYEGNFKDTTDMEVAYPDYYFRRLFWSYLLSGGGATYGAASTWRALNTYSTGWYTYTVGTPTPGVFSTTALVGLNSVRAIPGVLDSARVDLGLFEPQDALIAPTSTPTGTPTGAPTGAPDWAEFNRAQVARRGSQEILAYIPNTSPLTTPDAVGRRRAAAANTTATVSVNMSDFTDASYAVAWYNLQGTPATPTVIAGNPTPGATATRILTAPFGGDAVVHISSRCQTPNVCEHMDAEPPPAGQRSAAGFEAGYDETARMYLDTAQRVFGSGSWRCDRPLAPGSGFPGCWVRYDYDPARSIASADFYFRRNSISSATGVYFMVVYTSEGTQIVEGASLNVWLGPGGELHLDSDTKSDVIPPVQGVAPALNRWYHLSAHVQSVAGQGVDVTVSRDGAPVIPQARVAMSQTNVFFRRVIVHTAWWGPTTDLLENSRPSYWWDELTVDPPASEDLHGLYRTVFQQGLGYYAGNKATWFDYSGGYNNTNLLHVGANNAVKSLLRFDVSALPANAIVDEAILQVYYTGRSNGNSLTLGAHGVLADWVDSQANRVQRKTGVNWTVAGMGAGSDYTATVAATVAVTGAGGAWVELNVTNLAQAWVADAAHNYGLVLLQAAASGSVVYDFCSELGWSPCSAAQAPRLTVRYHLAQPPPVKATFQQGASGYTGNQATYFDYSGGYNNTSLLHVGADNAVKALLRFDVASIPASATVDEATLRVYQMGRSNGNSLTLAAHRVLPDWVDSQANRIQRKTGVNWSVAGMGSGSDYAVEADGSAALASAGGAWVELNVSDMAQDWVTDAANNHGLVLLQAAAGGYVVYDFCSELGWGPCTPAQAPVLTIWYH